MATSITVGSLPIGSEYINANMIGPDGNPIKWTVQTIHNAEQLIPSVTLVSEGIYWGQSYQYNNWIGSTLRQWFNGTSLNQFLNKWTADGIAKVLSHSTLLTTQGGTSVSDKVRINNIDTNQTGTNANYYAQAVIDIRDTNQVYYTNGSYYDVSGLPKPVITTYTPGNDLGMIYGAKWISYAISNPNNTSSLYVKIYCEANGYTLFETNNATFNEIQTLQMSPTQYQNIVDHSNIVITATDGLGVSNTIKLVYQRSSGGPVINQSSDGSIFSSNADTSVGIKNNSLWVTGVSATIRNSLKYETKGSVYLTDPNNVRTLVKGPTLCIANGATSGTFDYSLTSAQWNALAYGNYMLELVFAETTHDETATGGLAVVSRFTKRFMYFTKSPVSLSLTSPQPSDMGKFKNAITNLPLYVCDSDTTHNINMVYKIDGVRVDSSTLPGTTNGFYWTCPTAAWNALSNATHTLVITATDATVPSATASLTFTFTKTDLAIIVRSNPYLTGTMAKTICVNTNATLPTLTQYKIMVCNNANDPIPVWEDMTAEFLSKRTHTFTNTIKTDANKGWAVSVEVTITKDISQGKMSLNGFGYYYGL